MKKILIVEDDKIVASIYRNKLQNEGYEVEIASDGETAIESLKKSSPPELILLDLGLPKVSGVEVLKKIRSQPSTLAIPVIVLSNSYVTDQVQAAWKAGATKCLTKASCRPSDMVEIIQGVMAKAAAAAAAVQPPAPAVPRSAPVSQLPRAIEEIGGSFHDEVRQTFLNNIPSFSQELRRDIQAFARRGDGDYSLPNLFTFYHNVRSISGNAGIAGFHQIAQLSAALEALLRELYDKPRLIGPSPVRTIAQAVDALTTLFGSAAVSSTQDELPRSVIVLDDDPISRRTVSLALRRANLLAISLTDPTIALTLLEENPVDLIVSDIGMPGINGFEFCAQVRKQNLHQNTPLIFVTNSSDFEARTASRLSGGTDLLGKPFLFSELAVKALTLLVKPQHA